MFYNYSPVKLIHGEGSFKRISAEIPANAKIVVLHGSTLERYSDFVMEKINSWAASDVVRIRVGTDEPTDSGIDALVSQIPLDTTFIVGIGGGSVLDSTKAAAVCFGNKLSASELKKTVPMNWFATVKFGLVSSRPGSGSELNNAFVLMDEGSRFKRSYFSFYSYPLFAIHDPFFYQSLQPLDYANGVADAVSHVIDQYLVEREPQVVQDHMAISFLEIGKQLSSRAASPSPPDFLQLAWFSGLASSGLLSRGVRTSWILHQVAHSLASEFGIPHPTSISIASRSVLSMARHPQNRVKQVANALSCSDETNRRTLSDVEKIAQFFSDLGLPVGLESLPKEGIDLWMKSLRALCPDLTLEEIAFLCSHP